MSTKKVLFQFADSLKEIKVGDKIFLTSCNRRNSPPEEAIIKKIGLKYVGVGGEGSDRVWAQFDFNGHQHTDFVSHYTPYSSLEAIEEVKLRTRAITALTRVLNNNTLKHCTQKQIEDAALALGVFGKYAEEFKYMDGKTV